MAETVTRRPNLPSGGRPGPCPRTSLCPSRPPPSSSSAGWLGWGCGGGCTSRERRSPRWLHRAGPRVPLTTSPAPLRNHAPTWQPGSSDERPRDPRFWGARQIADDSASRAEARERPPVRASTTGGPWPESSLRRWWYQGCHRAGVPRVGVYEGTKHSLGTALRGKAVPLDVIQAIFCHADARSTERYARLGDQAVVRALRPSPRKSGGSVAAAQSEPRKALEQKGKWWRRRESNPRPHGVRRARLRV